MNNGLRNMRSAIGGPGASVGRRGTLDPAVPRGACPPTPRRACRACGQAAKSLSHKAPHDERGGELNEREVVLRLLLPADEQLAVAVEPRVRAFDDPPPR